MSKPRGGVRLKDVLSKTPRKGVFKGSRVLKPMGGGAFEGRFGQTNSEGVVKRICGSKWLEMTLKLF